MDQRESRPPVIFAFQPKSFRVMRTPEELREFERMMKEEVGLSADLANLAGTCTESSTGGQSDDCDQD
jgi:hypothetical protein